MRGRCGAWPLLALACCACTSALREPPTAAELAGTARHQPQAVGGLLAEAEQAYARWTVESMERAYATWQAAAAADPARVEGWIGTVRAAVWLTEHQQDAQRREVMAHSAVQHAQLCAAADPEQAACDYWLAIALGIQARERRSTALDALPRIVKLLQRAAALRPELDEAGPDRVLALVLVRAPGWPTGPGDADLALEHARRAVALRPDHAPNQLCLAETLEAVGLREEGRRAMRLAALRARELLDSGDPRAEPWLREIEVLEARFRSRSGAAGGSQ